MAKGLTAAAAGLMQRRLALLAALACLAGGAELDADVAKKVTGFDSAGPDLLKPGEWRSYGEGFEQKGTVFVCDNGPDRRAIRGAGQTVRLDQTFPRPILAAAESKAVSVGGGQDNNYSLYLDVLYKDGDQEWGIAAPFKPGTHDWQRREIKFLPAKPVSKINFHLLMRGHSGQAWFWKSELREIAPPGTALLFDGLPVTRDSSCPGGFQLRDAAEESDIYEFDEMSALDAELEVRETQERGAVFYGGRLKNLNEHDRAVTLYYVLPIEGDGWRWLADPRREIPVQAPQEYLQTSRYGTGANGRLSRYPLAAVARGRIGKAIALDMSKPAFFRVGFSAGCRELYIAFDFGLVPEKKEAEFRFCTFDFDAGWGFRAALQKYYSIFPEQFRCRIPEQGIWMPFHRISEVGNWRDFGFKFKEGDNETAWDDANGMITFRYTEPQTWWMAMPKEAPRTMEAALDQARRLAEEGDARAKALFASGYHNEAGEIPARLLDTPWTDGAVWSLNSSPSVAGEITDFKNKFGPGIVERLYGPERKADLDGEYIDSAECYVTDEINYRREHFAAARTPLSFSLETRQPGLFKNLLVQEYVRALAEEIHGRGKLMMANATPEHVCWLAPWLDVMGTETDWNPEGKWAPMPDSDLLYRRALCGPKPYCFLMNTAFERFPYELTEKFMKRSLAYGMFPGFFSHNASEGHYFSRPDLYDRDRPLFKKYVPLCRRVAEAGWRPVTGARSSDTKVYLERFGEEYLTVLNDSLETRKARITLDGRAPDSSRELVSDRKLDWKGGFLEITLAGEDVAVIQMSWKESGRK